MKQFLLIIIILLAAFLRFYQLGSLPPSLTWDEVAWGYNAYSIGIDGKDEFGRFLPTDYLESFGDFKPPIYAYLDIFPIKFFGLTELAVRFPSAFFGTLTVLLTYFLVKAIFGKREEIALVATFLLAISPWHIMLSRAAFEANVASFFLVAGVLLFLEAVYRKPWLLLCSAASFVTAVYTFNSARIVGPLLVFGLALFFWKKLFLLKKQVVVAIVFGLLLLLPTLPFLFSPQASLRFKEVNIFSDISIIERTNQEVTNDQQAWWSKIIHNRRFAYSVEYLKHYLDAFSSSFLFITGDQNPKFSSQSLGQLYPFELPFLIAGALFLFRKREKYWWIIPLWLFIGIIPSATARETPHALRMETTLPMFQILVAYGLINSLASLKTTIARRQFRYIIIGLTVIVAFYNISLFFEDYFIHYAKAYSREWQYGYKDALGYVKEVSKKYDKIFITADLGRPYIYTVFYLQYNPNMFRENAVVQRDPFGFVTIKSIDKYYFDKGILANTENNRVLFIVVPTEVPKEAKVQKTFYLLNGEKALVAYSL